MANTWFNEDVYLQNKLTAWQDEAGNADKDLNALKKAIADAGMTPESHFLQFGADEGLSPNEFFVIDEYVANQVVFLNDRDGVTTWTAKSFKDAVKAAGMTLWSHYQQYGWAEANPSNSFDAEQYFADKLTALQEDPATKAEWAEKTVNDVKDAFEKAGIDPVSHYFAYGKDEGVAVTPVDAQPNTLTEALAALKAANEAKEAFLKATKSNEVLAENQNLDKDSTVDAVEAAITAEFNAQTGLVAVAVDDTQFSTRSVAIQDSLIADAKSVKEKAVSTAVTKAGAASEGLIATAQDKAKALATALDAAWKAENVTYADAKTVFEALNTTSSIVLTAPATAGEFQIVDGKLLSFNSAVFTVAEQKSGVWTLTTEGKALNLKSVTELLAAYDATVTADKAVTTAREALNKAVEAVYLNENPGFYSAFNPQAAVTETPTTAANVESSVALDFTVAVKLFETKAEATTAANGTKQVFTAKINAAADAAETVTFDGVTYTAGAAADANAEATAAAFVAEYNASTTTNWTVKANGDTLTFTAKVAATSSTAPSFTGDVSVTTTNVTAGVVAGTSGAAVDKTASLAEAVADAKTDLNTLNELIADFLNARTLAQDLEKAEKAIEAAETALTAPVEDGGFGLTLLEGADNFSAADDVYFFNAAHGNEDLVNFGQSGIDKIFFGGAYKFVEIAEGKTIADNVGDVNALEILWQQDGNNVKLYVEKEAFAGNGSTTADIVTIELVATDASKIAFDGTFLTAGTAAA